MTLKGKLDKGFVLMHTAMELQYISKGKGSGQFGC